MKKITIALLICFSLSLQAQVKKFGFYTNERSGDGEHSFGYTFQLWKYNNTIIGKVSFTEGLIGDQVSSFISDVHYNPETNAISFVSKIDNTPLEFNGTIYKSEIRGVFKWNLKKVTKLETLKLCCKDAEINVDYKSFEDWKAMWKQFDY